MAEKTWHEAFDEWARNPKKPCPGCGSDNMDVAAGRYDDQAHLYQVVCLDCGISGPLEDIETLAWFRWEEMPRKAESEVARAK